MSSSWLSSCPAHQVPGIIQPLGNEIKELVLCPESFWGSPSSAVTNISSGCSGVGKSTFWACSAGTGSRSCKPQTLFWLLWEYPEFPGIQQSVPSRAQPSLGKQEGLAGCSVTGSIPTLCSSLGTFLGWCHPAGSSGNVPGHGDIGALLIFPFWSCSLPCSWVTFGPSHCQGWAGAPEGRELLTQAGAVRGKSLH